MISCTRVLAAVFICIASSSIPHSFASIHDPHFNDEYFVHRVMDIAKHPRYNLILKGAPSQYLERLKRSKYSCVSGGYECSDIDTILYSIYPILRDPASSQYAYFFKSVIRANMDKLGNRRHYNEADFSTAEKEIFPAVMHFTDLSLDQLETLRRCFVYIIVSYVVDRADKVRTGLCDSRGVREVTPEEAISVVNDMLGGERSSSEAGLLAIQEELGLDVVYVFVVDGCNLG